MNRIVQTKRSEQGQSIVELALTITVLMALLAGTIDLGRAFFTWLALRDAAQEAAAYGSIKPLDVTGMRSRALDNLKQIAPDPSTDVSMTVSYPDTKKCLGNAIKIDVYYQHFPITMPFLGTLLGSQEIPIHATVNDTILMPMCP